MENANKYYLMSLDELDVEIAETRKLLKALEQLKTTKKKFGEKSTKQIENLKKPKKAVTTKKSTDSTAQKSDVKVDDSTTSESAFAAIDSYPKY